MSISVVGDTESSDLIIKLANLLPMEVKAEIDLAPYKIKESTASLTLLKGKPADLDALPEERTMTVNESFDYSLPAYSFSIIRLKTDIK